MKETINAATDKLKAMFPDKGYMFNMVVGSEIDLPIKAILLLEYLGVNIEKPSTDEDVLMIKISLPEKLEVDTTELGLYLPVEDKKALAKLAKSVIIHYTVEQLGEKFGTDDEFYNEVKKDTSKYIRVFAKTRHEDVWTKDRAVARVKHLLNTHSEYEEV